MRKILFALIIFVPSTMLGQKKTFIEIPTYTNVTKTDKGYMMTGIIVDGDTFPHVKLYRIIVYPQRKFASKKEKKRYDQLMFNVKKIYPFAVIIGNLYREIERDLANIPDQSDQRKYVKSREKELRKEYEETLINLTFTQGRLLIKLVDRQTDHTTFEVIEQFKGEMNAYFWQSLARLFGTNLKSEYDANKEDKIIEEIIALIENGQL